MAVTGKFIKGNEKELYSFLDRMRGNHSVRWSGAFAHMDDITIERINAFDGNMRVIYGYTLTMPHPNGTFCGHNEFTHHIYEEIRLNRHSD